MYSKKTTQKMIEGFASREGWTPTYHTIEEVDEFRKYIDSVVNIESNSKSSYITLSKPLSAAKQKEVSRWIENEQVLCVADYSYWESRYAHVQTETGEIVRFKNRKAQTILDSIISDLDEKELAKEIIVLGSRQTGTSTKVLLMCIHRALYSPNSSVLASSANPIRNEFMEQVVTTAYNMCPWWLVPSRLPKKKFSNGSILSTASGSTLAQGWTPNCVFISNAEEYATPVKTFEEGLFRATFPSKNSMMVIHGNIPQESTWLRNLWNYSKEYYPKGMSRFMPVFIPWYAASDIYPTTEWTARFPSPDKWVPSKETKEHAQRCELYVRNTPMLTKALGKSWKMPSEQKWYWEFCYNYAKKIDAMDNFLSQMAADDRDHLDNGKVPEEDVDLDKLFPNATETQKKL